MGSHSTLCSRTTAAGKRTCKPPYIYDVSALVKYLELVLASLSWVASVTIQCLKWVVNQKLQFCHHLMTFMSFPKVIWAKSWEQN